MKRSPYEITNDISVEETAKNNKGTSRTPFLAKSTWCGGRERAMKMAIKVY